MRETSLWAIDIAEATGWLRQGDHDLCPTCREHWAADVAEEDEAWAEFTVAAEVKAADLMAEDRPAWEQM